MPLGPPAPSMAHRADRAESIMGSRALFPQGPSFSEEDFSTKDFITRDFIDELAEAAVPVNRRSGPVSQPAFDPKPLIRTFESMCLLCCKSWLACERLLTGRRHSRCAVTVGFTIREAGGGRVGPPGRSTEGRVAARPDSGYSWTKTRRVDGTIRSPRPNIKSPQRCQWE